MAQWRVFLGIIALAFSLANAQAFDSALLDPSVSVGGFYAIDATTSSIVNASTPCVAVFRDRFNNTVRAFTTDPDHNNVMLTRDGFVHSFVKLDDAFLVGETYNLTLTCGAFTALQPVFIDTAGDWEINRMAANLTHYYNSHPVESFAGIILAFFAVAAAIGLYSKVKRR